MPLTPESLRIPAAELRFCSVSATRLGNAVEVFDFDEVELLLDDVGVLELCDPLDDELVLEPEVPCELEIVELEFDGAVGSKAELPTPKPMAAASVPLPTTAIESLSFLLVMTSLPELLSDALTCALVGRSRLIALIKSPTVSVPVEV